MTQVKSKLTVEEFLSLPEGDDSLEDSLLEGLKITPQQIFQRAKILL